ncbi:MAG: NADPH-dependent F420 reductase [Candidatus Thorarchaeota archaeon]
MKIGIIGTGNVGTSLGEAWAAKGHEIMFGSRDPHRAQQLVEKIKYNTRGGTYKQATTFGEVVILAVPWPYIKQTLESMGNLKGKILIDCINPVKPQLEGLELGLDTSAAERIAEMANDAIVIKALNSIGNQHYINPKFGDMYASGFICGDDDRAKKVVARLVADLGFDVVDCGPLQNARLLEPLALLWIKLAYVHGFGPNVAFKLLKK